MNTLLRFNKLVDGEKINGWHLLAKLADGEFTACGIASTDYDHLTKEGAKKDITCKDCKEVINYYKSLK